MNGAMVGTLSLLIWRFYIFVLILHLKLKLSTRKKTHTLNGNFGSDVNVILNVTLPPPLELVADADDESPEIESDLHNHIWFET